MKIFCRLLISLIYNKDKYHLLWIDESSICPSNFKKNAWIQRGMQRIIVGNVKYEKLTLIGVIDNTKCLGLKIIYSGHNTQIFNHFMYTVLSKLTPEETQNRQIVLVMDNATIHRSKEFQKAMKDRNVIILYNIPHHPEFNSIELFWEKLKRPLRQISKYSKFSKKQKRID